MLIWEKDNKVYQVNRAALKVKKKKNWGLAFSL